MAWFEYTGMTPGGTVITGRVEALDRPRASAELAEMRIDVRELTEAEAPVVRAAGLTTEDLIFFNEQLASLADAGIALDEGLAQLARDVESPRLRHWIADLVNDVRAGKSLDRAVADRERDLPVLYSSVLRAGIESGQLATTLLNLNQHLRLTGNTRRILWETATYPLIVAVMALAVVSFFFIGMMPSFRSIFNDFGTQLPALTVAIIAIADHFPMVLAGLGVVVLAVVLTWCSLRLTPGGRGWRERIVCAIPLVGQVYRASLVARFLRSMATAVASGIALPRALRLGAGATGSAILEADAERLAAEVERGESIFVANQSARLIPPLFGFCVQTAVGREALPAAIGKLAWSYENRAMHGQSRLRVLLFPLLIVLVGSLLGVGIIGMFLPLIVLINAISGG